MSDVLTTFEQFLDQTESSEMFITGEAGTGKTYSLKQLVDYCKANNHTFVVSAYTHKAIKVLQDRIGTDNCQYFTVDSLLQKIPGTNKDARKVSEVNSTVKIPGFKALPKILFVDEFSNLGSYSYKLIKEYMYKVVYIGDLNQLHPVNDVCKIKPGGKFWVKLTKVHRQADDSQILDITKILNRCIQSKVRFSGITPNKDVIKIDESDIPENTKILAYTNSTVEYWNKKLQERETPIQGDRLFNASDSREYIFVEELSLADCEGRKVSGPLGVMDYSKLKEVYAFTNLTRVYTVVDLNGIETNKLVIFGHKKFNDFINELRKIAVNKNNYVARKFKLNNIENPTYEASISDEYLSRNESWARYMESRANICCFDFNHAITVHKSQGSTYDNVFIDIEDLSKCRDRNYELYLRLLYVGISRARDKVYFNY